MPHINTDPGQHDLTVSGFIVQLDSGEPRLLLHRHKKLDVYLQFGGHVELDESPWQALTHELLEESGYDIDQLDVLQPAVHFQAASGKAAWQPVPFGLTTHPFRLDKTHFHTDLVYALTTSQLPRHPIGQDEAATARLFTTAELRALPETDIYPDMRQAGLFVLETLLQEYETVPANTFASQPAQPDDQA